ncbi:MAG TPA: hypothetical protein VF721_13525, partial [Pyrinomonadaceae bacterium]
MELKDLCLSLAKCNTENEVIEILKAEELWDDEEKWQFFGDNENNYSIIGNQQSKPEAAIVEKIINSVDAMLMAECLKRKIKPDSDQAPQSIKQALSSFYKIHEGKLTNIDTTERGKLAENICFIATGTKKNPSYTIVDKGEGQTPGNLKNTILSLGKSNKLRIPFVQGKFNMGGTGVFRFCGQHNIQLIISKRHPEIAKNEHDPTKNYWGFTIVRREDPKQGVRSSNYKYLSVNEQILFFDAPSLSLLPGTYPSAYEKELEWGTFMKFYEYQIGPYKSPVLFDLYNKLSLLMPNIALPVRMYERRPGYKANSYETNLAGLSVRINEDKSNNIEEGYPTSGFLTVLGQKMKYSIYVFKRGKSEKYTKNEGIIFTINGQTHGYLSKAFYNRKAVGLAYLADSILVNLDCTDFDGRAREDLFMNSRDRLSDCVLKSEIESSLEDLLRNHPGLKLLKEKRRREEIEDKLNDAKPLVEVLENILRKSPTLSRLFIKGVRLQNPFDNRPTGSVDVFDGKEFPTYFNLTKNYPSNSPKEASLGSRFRIQFKTDVSNDYFDRNKNPGEFKVFLNGIEYKDTSINLWNGYATLNVLIENRNIDEILHFKTEVSDISRTEPFKSEFYVRVIEPLQKRPSQSGKRR